MLREQVPGQREQLAEIDIRLLEYYTDLCYHSGWEAEDANDWHNLHELLAALKMLRIMRTYPINVAKVQQVIRLREGEWHREGTIWKYDSGGLLLPGTRDATHYRWMPYQVFILTAMYGANVWIDTEVPIGTRKLLPTEREGANGTIEDLRRTSPSTRPARPTRRGSPPTTTSSTLCSRTQTPRYTAAPTVRRRAGCSTTARRSSSGRWAQRGDASASRRRRPTGSPGRYAPPSCGR